VLSATDPTHGVVPQFNYSSSNYPQPGSVIGSVPANQYFGNSMSVNCTATGSVTIN
jgi:hypothetical protein